MRVATLDYATILSSLIGPLVDVIRWCNNFFVISFHLGTLKAEYASLQALVD